MTLAKLKLAVDRHNTTVAEQVGHRNAALSALKDLGCKDLAAAERKLAQLNKQGAAAQEELDGMMETFTKKWADELPTN